VIAPRAHSRCRASLSDAALLSSIAEGDLSALGEIYDRHASDVWRAARRMLGSGPDVDDVVQNVFTKLPQIAHSYDGRASARAWLLGIGARFALRHRRGVGRFARMLASLAPTVRASAGSDPEQQVTERRELQAFEAALEHLAPKKRAVFVLAELEGLTTEEIALALQIPPATVRTRLHHARHELHAAVKRESPSRA
jgi:RNA polymerase sigma-70 factor (ECF subfamily)